MSTNLIRQAEKFKESIKKYNEKGLINKFIVYKALLENKFDLKILNLEKTIEEDIKNDEKIDKFKEMISILKEL